MRVSGGLNTSGVSNLYNTLFQGKVAMHVSKLSREFFPVNNGKGEGLFSSNALGYINDIKSSSSALSSSLKELSGPAFSQRTMVSSNTDAMTVNFTGSSMIGMGETKVKIDQVAAGQLNEGESVISKDTYEGDKGTVKFSVETGGKKVELSINISASDSNVNVQQKMANAINSAGLGLKATVQNNVATNSSVLRIESTNTGTDAKNSFVLRDITGDLVARTGANSIASAGQDAIYSVNGGPAKTSQTNTVNLGNGLSATFKAASEDAVTISRGKDTDYAKKTVNDMVKSFNSLFSAAAGNVNDPKAQNLASRMINVSSAYSKSLSDIGIGFDNSGRMTIDSERLNKAAESGRLEQFFTESSGRNFGFSASLGRLASQVSTNTSNFVSTSLFGNTLGENFAYSGFGDLIQYNFMGTGSLLDYMF